MRLRMVALVVVLVMLMSISALAFDGNRKGFILGGGLGFGMTSYQFKSGSYESDKESKSGVMTDFKIGYAPSEQVEIYYFSKVSWITVDYDTDDAKATTGVGGIGTTYSLKTQAPTFYIAGGLGFSSWSYPFEEDPPDPMTGFGLFAGGGYEFAKHFNVEFDIMYGSPSQKDNGIKTEVNPLSFKLTVNALAY